MEQMLKLCVFLMRAKLTLVEAVEHTVAVDKLAVRGLFTYALNVLSKINRNGGLEGWGVVAVGEQKQNRVHVVSQCRSKARLRCIGCLHPGATSAPNVRKPH